MGGGKMPLIHRFLSRKEICESVSFYILIIKSLVLRFQSKQSFIIMIKKLSFALMILLTAIAFAQAQTPALNQKIVDYATSQLGKKVDRGECWDLANQALTKYNCRWDGKYAYGKKLDPKTDTVYPGDILLFTNVIIKYKEGGMEYKETYPNHTAIIYEVTGKDTYKLIHQNFGDVGRKVGISNLFLSHKVTGRVIFYRPVAK